MKYKNTLKKGSIRTIIFQEDNEWFGVALEFNIVEHGNDPREVMIMLDEAIRGYVQSARKANLGLHVLNQTPDVEYESLWKKLEAKKFTLSPIRVHSFGLRALALV